MLGDKKTLPFWRRRKPNFLEIERALAPEEGNAASARPTPSMP